MIYQILKIIDLTYPTIISISCVLLSIIFLNWVLLKRNPLMDNDKKLPRQVAILFFVFVGFVIIILSLPISENNKNQVLSLLGILISAIIAFSSTTIVSNLMAGIMLRITKPFRTGDFIRIGEYFGRITVRGILDTEIQNEHRELLSLPNSYMISNPVTVVRSSGTVISVSLSLGYDIHHSIIQTHLLEAAKKAGLSDSFVHILELGDFSVTYRISGLLPEVKNLITAKSNLYFSVLDSLHDNGIEIVSPNFMNQKRLDENIKIIPTPVKMQKKVKMSEAEEIVFDKAEDAVKHEETIQKLTEDIEKMKTQLETSDDKIKEKLEKQIQKKEESLKLIKELTEL